MNKYSPAPIGATGCILPVTSPTGEAGAPNLPKFIYPVYGFAVDGYFKREPIASFFDWGAAVDLVNYPDRDGFERRSLYIGVRIPLARRHRRADRDLDSVQPWHLLDAEALS